MATSTAGAHTVLAAVTADDLWLGIALEVGASLSTVTQADATYLGTPRVLIPGGSGWQAPAGRHVVAAAGTDHGQALQDFTPEWIVWWTAPAGGSPLFARRVTDTSVGVGDAVLVPASTIRLSYHGF
ncbi:hypothetical protein [Janibacter sp. LM]|uniref:hypothetical protein n=1 Tax=Janibacter sp. LM TaxID=3144845 RepID=UPI0031F61635